MITWDSDLVRSMVDRHPARYRAARLRSSSLVSGAQRETTITSLELGALGLRIAHPSSVGMILFFCEGATCLGGPWITRPIERSCREGFLDEAAASFRRKINVKCCLNHINLPSCQHEQRSLTADDSLLWSVQSSTKDL